MATPEKRRERAHTVERAAVAPAGAIATAVAAEKARDQFKAENPAKFRRAVKKVPGPLRRVIGSGHVRSGAVLTSAALGGVAYGAERYQDLSLERESQRDKARAKAARVREEIGPKGAGMGSLQELAKASDRDKRNASRAGAAGAGVLGASAYRSNEAAQRATRTAGNFKHVRNASLATGAPLAAAAGLDAKARVKRVRAAGTTVPAGWEKPPPPRPVSPKAVGGARQAAIMRHARESSAHAKASQDFDAAVRRHPTNRAARRGAAISESLGFVRRPATGTAAGALGSAAGAHVGAVKATREAARHTRAARTKAGAAAGLLGLAAAAHHSRTPSRRVAYY